MVGVGNSETRNQEQNLRKGRRTDMYIKASAGVGFGSQHFWYVGYKLAGFKQITFRCWW